MRKVWKNSIALTLILIILCMNNFSVMAADERHESNLHIIHMYEEYGHTESMEEFVCWNCGNYSFINTQEAGEWHEFARYPCIHGKNFCIVEERNIYDIVICTYCQYINEKIWARMEYRERCI